MLTLDNGQLAVELLDPSADRARFGVRYCTGGYIFQVHDPRVGPLMSGPTYPTSFNWFDGQGIPDAFNLGPLPSRTQAGHAVVIGIGLCDLNTRTVLDFCDWSITREGHAIRFVTAQALEGRAFTLCRTVSLAGRTVRSTTELANTGRGEVSIRWFPHPFYPQPDSDELVWFNTPLHWVDGPGYRRLDNGFLARAAGAFSETMADPRAEPKSVGHYLPLDHDAHAPLVLLQRHPLLGLVGAATSYIPSFFPIWGNAITFSWEPFFERSVAPGQTATWSVQYVF